MNTFKTALFVASCVLAIFVLGLDLLVWRPG